MFAKNKIMKFLTKYGAESNLHVALNVSPLTDLFTGSFIKNKEGVWFLNGGLCPINGLSGGNNTQKTGKVVNDCARLLHRFKKIIILYGDMESTLDISRFARRVDKEFGIPGYFKEHIENKRFFYMPSSAGVDGTELHNRMKEIYTTITALKNSKDKEDQEAYQEMMITSPFWDENKKSYTEFLSPILLVCDSITETSFDKLAFKQFDEGDIDIGGKKRTRDVEIGNLRRILMEDTCRLGPRVGIYSYWLAQTSDKMSLDGRPQEKDSTFIQHNKKVSAPKSMLKLPHIGLNLVKGSVLKHADHTSLYPSKNNGTSNDAKLNPDLVEYASTIFRNKMGQSTAMGIPFIASQSEGIREDLSMYSILKTAGYYGLNGNNVRHQCAFVPDVTIMRTTVNDLLKENEILLRGITLCFHMWYIQTLWSGIPEEFRVGPAEVYEKLVAQGHDVNELLMSIDFWHDNEEFIKKPTLTVYELLEIAINNKPIYWKVK